MQEWRDATAQAEAVARGEVSAAELLDAAIARADRSELNAVPIRFDEVARRRAGETLSGPFAGVPFLLKDIGQEFAGELATNGSRGRAHHRAAEHSAYTRRCLEAGLVIFGRTATPELGLKAVSEATLWGPTRNPWDRSRSPGGSSGGSAAAVASGIVAMAGANDGGGSIRIPASYCGLFGLKPSRGRVSWAPQMQDSWEGAAVNGVLTVSVRDSARMLDVLAGPEPGDAVALPPPARPYAEEVGAPPGRLRIGVSRESPLGTPVNPAAIEAVDRAARLLEQLGHVVEPAAPVFEGRALARAYLTLYLGQVAADLEAMGPGEADCEFDTRFLALLGRALPSATYVASRRSWHDFARALAHFHERYDLWLLPSVAGPPPLLGAFDMPAAQRRILGLLRRLRAGRLVLRAGLLERLAAEGLAHTPFTQFANLAFAPAMSVPTHWAGSPALPFGAQFVARPGAEDMLFRVAAQLEAASPWQDRLPFKNLDGPPPKP